MQRDDARTQPHDGGNQPGDQVSTQTSQSGASTSSGPTLRALVREAAVSARSQPVASLVAVLILATVCTVVLATTGQAAASERRVIERLDATGSRTLVFSDPSGSAGLSSDRLDAVSNLDGIEWVVALGVPQDMTNAAMGPGAAPVAVRPIFTALPPPLTQTAGRIPNADEILIGAAALVTGGFASPVGALTRNQRAAPVVGGFTAVAPLSALRDVALVQQQAEGRQPLQTLVVVARTVHDVPALEKVIPGMLVVDDPTSLQVSSPTILADLQDVVSGEVGRNTRRLMLLVLATGLVLVGVTQYGNMATRRRDLGRRRALGATRADLMTVIVIQTLACAAVGVLLGSVAGIVVVHFIAGAVPGLAFVAGVAGLVTVSATLAAVPPAVAAARVDPVRILRVP